MEKPCAINAAEAADIATHAAAAGVFAAVPYVIRYSPLIETIREVARDEAMQYAMFKFIGGMVDRYYQQKVEWVVDRSMSGGGPLLNLGVHFTDLCRVLLGGADLAVTGAMMSNRQAGSVDRGPCRGADAGRRRELHGGDWVPVSGTELGVRSALQHPDGEALFRGTR